VRDTAHVEDVQPLPSAPLLVSAKSTEVLEMKNHGTYYVVARNEPAKAELAEFLYRTMTGARKNSRGTKNEVVLDQVADVEYASRQALIEMANFHDAMRKNPRRQERYLADNANIVGYELEMSTGTFKLEVR